ncbi:MAG: nickel pincer cofactor biosynthesis protein LarB [Gemmatimonadetes bacterium]|nr:nickel pincer cofactor biosynthesis protein LarB [Gemmatimonadota bacterium]
MGRTRIEGLLEDVRRGELSVSDACERLRAFPEQDLGVALLDHGRELRTGAPEAVLAEGKTAEQVLAIARQIEETEGRVLVTRVDPSLAQRLVGTLRAGRHNPLGRTVCSGALAARGRGPVAVVCAGTADLPVAEEAGETLTFLGHRTERVHDVGVAGLHRVIARLDVLRRATVLIVVAGMEGALPSVIAGLVAAPVVAVPTSVGYGASFGGIAALLGMLNSCAAGVAVVNIDNGFGAASLASRIDASLT